jgi:hypothetical protein
VTHGQRKCIGDDSSFQIFLTLLAFMTDPSDHVVKGVVMWPLDFWDYGFESHWGLGCLSLVGVVCSQVEASALGRSLVNS